MIVPRKEIYQQDKKEKKKNTYILVSIKSPAKLVYFRERDKKGMIVRNELDFNDPITSLAAKQTGFEYKDCIFKKKEDFTEKIPEITNLKYRLHRKHVYEAQKQVYYQRIKLLESLKKHSSSVNILTRKNNLNSSCILRIKQSVIDESKIVVTKKKNDQIEDFLNREIKINHIVRNENERLLRQLKTHSTIQVKTQKKKELIDGRQKHAREYSKIKLNENQMKSKKFYETALNTCNVSRNTDYHLLSTQMYTHLNQDHCTSIEENEEIRKRLEILDKKIRKYRFNQRVKLKEIFLKAQNNSLTTFNHKRMSNSFLSQPECQINTILEKSYSKLIKAHNSRNKKLNFIKLLNPIANIDRTNRVLEKFNEIQNRRFETLIEKQNEEDKRILFWETRKKESSISHHKLDFFKSIQERNLERTKRINENRRSEFQIKYEKYSNKYECKKDKALKFKSKLIKKNLNNEWKSKCNSQKPVNELKEELYSGKTQKTSLLKVSSLKKKFSVQIPSCNEILENNTNDFDKIFYKK